jgi:hypothetical protein
MILSCASVHPESESLQKCDRGLRQKLEDPGQTDDSDMIEIIGRCKAPITNEDLQKLCDTGVAVGTATGEVFTASGTASEIRKLASIDFIKTLRLPQQTKPLSH